jgi:hypothetical protein
MPHRLRLGAHGSVGGPDAIRWHAGYFVLILGRLLDAVVDVAQCRRRRIKRPLMAARVVESSAPVEIPHASWAR